MKIKKKWPFVLAALVVAGVGVRTAVSRATQEAVQTIQAMNVMSEVAETGDIAKTVTGTGSLAKVNSEEVITRVGLITEKVFVKEGDYVEEGTPIASYTELSIQTELLAVRKNIAAKKKEIDELDKEGEEYELEKSVAEGELNTLRKSQAELEKLLKDPVLKSDVAGVIETVNLKAGEKIVKNSYSGTSAASTADISAAFPAAFAQMSAAMDQAEGPVVSADGYHVSVGGIRTGTAIVAEEEGGICQLSARQMRGVSAASGYAGTAYMRATVPSGEIQEAEDGGLASEAENDNPDPEAEASNPTLAVLEAQGIDIGDGSALSGLCAVAVPAEGNAPQTEIAMAEGQTLIEEPVTVIWSPDVDGTFAGGTVYTATITLRAAGENYFYSTAAPEAIVVAVPGAAGTTWSVGDELETGKYGSVTVTAVYPMTAEAAQTLPTEEPTPTEEPEEPAPTEEPAEPTPTEEPEEPTPTEEPEEPTPTEEPEEPTPTEEPAEPTPAGGTEAPTQPATPTPDWGDLFPTPPGTNPFPAFDGDLTPEQMQVIVDYLRTLTPDELEKLLEQAGAGNIDLDNLDINDTLLERLISGLGADSLVNLLQNVTDSLSTSIPDLVKSLSGLLGAGGLTGGGSGADLSSLMGGSGADLSSLMGGGSGFDLSALTGGASGMDLSGLTGAASSVDLVGSGSYNPDYTAAVTILPGSLAVLSINVDELDINALTVGQEAVITLDALEGQEFEGVITDIADEAVSGTGSARFPVELLLVKTDEMKYGMSASAVITVSESKGTVLISLDALQSENGQSCVYTDLDENGEPSGLTPVETGLSNGTKVEIVSGLSSGTTVYYKSNAGNGFPFGRGQSESEDEA